MTIVRSYRDLQVWQKAMDLVDGVCDVAGQLPGTERYGMSTQLRRAAVSVPANIAEGHASAHTKQYLRHLSIALGSLAEIETLLLIAQRRAYITETMVQTMLDLAAEIGRMLRGLQKSLQRKLQPAPSPQPLAPSP